VEAGRDHLLLLHWAASWPEIELFESKLISSCAKLAAFIFTPGGGFDCHLSFGTRRDPSPDLGKVPLLRYFIIDEPNRHTDVPTCILRAIQAAIDISQNSPVPHTYSEADSSPMTDVAASRYDAISDASDGGAETGERGVRANAGRALGTQSLPTARYLLYPCFGHFFLPLILLIRSPPTYFLAPRAAG